MLSSFFLGFAVAGAVIASPVAPAVSSSASASQATPVASSSAKSGSKVWIGIPAPKSAASVAAPVGVPSQAIPAVVSAITSAPKASVVGLEIKSAISNAEPPATASRDFWGVGPYTTVLTWGCPAVRPSPLLIDKPRPTLVISVEGSSIEKSATLSTSSLASPSQIKSPPYVSPVTSTIATIAIIKPSASSIMVHTWSNRCGGDGASSMASRCAGDASSTVSSSAIKPAVTSMVKTSNPSQARSAIPSPVRSAVPASVWSAKPTPSIRAKCGAGWYDSNQYDCYDGGHLCPKSSGAPQLPCGSACYFPHRYTCRNGKLEGLPNYSGAFKIYAHNPEVFDWQDKEQGQIQACHKAFWIQDGPACTYVPDVVRKVTPDWPYANETVLRTPRNMNTMVPGGQNFWVEKNGEFGISTPHSAWAPPGVIEGDAIVYENGTFTVSGTLGWYACPSTKVGKHYQIFAHIQGVQVAKNCVPISILMEPWFPDVPGRLTAWQYE
ncbi:hypothetical protein BT63DRAFT_450631 [Microthyrium microscopicum]|uniref:Endo-1,3(4)-beta-glucanase 1 carbohydrate binding domain-containing protein n=1 Tax=Microthyrium microscopicum TaxID=703497 RepID=A0A6A6UK06_9PEZI|nr:hypothetical protein BT63DRAFT_450631 [Microthyrium microscopicum]